MIIRIASSSRMCLRERSRPGSSLRSKIFPGTKRDYSVYVPAQYKADKPASLMVFMDGAGYAKTDGAFRVPIVFDNLIHQKAMPVTIAVFVNPGTIAATKPGAEDRSNRSFEYDSHGRSLREVSDRRVSAGRIEGPERFDRSRKSEPYAGFLRAASVHSPPRGRRPDQFGKVLSHIGSFTNIRGGWAYPGLVRKTKDKPKPIKVYLQDGKDDLNNLHGNWPLGNQDLAAALQFAGYKYKLVMTEGGHSGKWGGETASRSAAMAVGRQCGIDQHCRDRRNQTRVEAAS